MPTKKEAAPIIDDEPPREGETQADANERRAKDQDAAMEAALLAGSLPDEDRRLADEKDAQIASLRPLCDAVWNYLAIDNAEEFAAWYIALRDAKANPTTPTIEDLLATLPDGSRVHWTPGHFRVWRGAGSASFGEGSTLARAIRMTDACQIHDPDKPSRFILVDGAGVPIPPE